MRYYLLGYADPVPVRGVDDVDDGVGVGVVAAPVWPDGGLPAEVPHLELEVLVRHLLHVEPDRRDRRHNLAHLEI